MGWCKCKFNKCKDRGNEMGVNLTSGRIEEMGGCKCTYNKCKDRGNEVGVNVTARGQREMGWL